MDGAIGIAIFRFDGERLLGVVTAINGALMAVMPALVRCVGHLEDQCTGGRSMYRRPGRGGRLEKRPVARGGPIRNATADNATWCYERALVCLPGGQAVADGDQRESGAVAPAFSAGYTTAAW